MSDEEALTQRLIEWHAAGRPLPGEVAFGDHHVVEPFEKGILAAVIDGLGHGPEAAVAAETAAAVVKEHPAEDVVSLLCRCDEALRKTRGAVMSVASFDGRRNTMCWAGVGNVEGVLIGSNGIHETLMSRSGIVGCSFADPPVRVLNVRQGDLLILATDGIGDGFREDHRVIDSTEQIASGILEHHAKETDDALVLVVRYLGYEA